MAAAGAVLLHADCKPGECRTSSAPSRTPARRRGSSLWPPAHVLRHIWASHRVMAGAPLMVAAQALGHADTRIVEKHYGHLAPSYVRDVIRATALGIGEEAERVATLRPGA